jgi:hypothetical protein
MEICKNKSQDFVLKHLFQFLDLFLFGPKDKSFLFNLPYVSFLLCQKFNSPILSGIEGSILMVIY